MNAELIRVEIGKKGTFGVWLWNGETFCVTLELPWKNNQRQISSIPAGKYICERRPSPLITRLTQGRWKTGFVVTNVPGRSDIMIHSGRLIAHTRGCILAASAFGKLKSAQREVVNSGQTFLEFMDFTKDVDRFELTIREVDLNPEYV